MSTAIHVNWLSILSTMPFHNLLLVGSPCKNRIGYPDPRDSRYIELHLVAELIMIQAVTFVEPSIHLQKR